MSFWYLATPYSKYPQGTEAAFQMACVEASTFIMARVPVYCPIAHTHPIAVAGALDVYDLDIWLPADEPFMACARGLVVAMHETWAQSKGIAHEIERFERDGKPVLMAEPYCGADLVKAYLEEFVEVY